MYTVHENTKEILFWCTGRKECASAKRVHSPDDESTSRKRSRYDNHTEKMIEVESVEEELMKDHKDVYSREQIRAWAHLIQMGKHESYTTPPDKLFWRRPAKSKNLNKQSAVSVSPDKSVHLRGQLVDQLLKWHELLEKGGITQTQYDELQGTIMKDVKKI